ncbi:hypothetical protein AX16_009785 [Volvariella volvacea WC 439]|nr:hypothetical protein AX16_009785 [Volvariella volvacea WC 439]
MGLPSNVNPAMGGKMTTEAGKTNSDKPSSGGEEYRFVPNSIPGIKSDTLLAPVSSWNPQTYNLTLPILQLASAVETAATPSADKLKHSKPHPSPSQHDIEKDSMHRDVQNLRLNLKSSWTPPKPSSPLPPHLLKWNWDIEHQDRQREAKADKALLDATPFQVDRRVLKDVVLEKMGVDVARITFLSSGTFHKAYLVTLVDGVELVARVARRFMPRLKTESEVATMQYLRDNTDVPVPIVYHYDSNPYNRLGGEYILMSKAAGIPLSRVFHSLGYNELVKLTNNLAAIVVALFSHRFSEIGSLYFGPNPRDITGTPSAATPKAAQLHYQAFPFSPTLGFSNLSFTPVNNNNSAKSPPPPSSPKPKPTQAYHIGPIISWPFFGSNRGDLKHPTEINRGPWSSSKDYYQSCAERETQGVILENEGRAAPHRLHLDPDEIRSSRHHHLNAVPGDESDDSDEYDLEESEEEWEGPGDIMYRDYRRMQRSTFLVAHLNQREQAVRKEMERWMKVMERLSKASLSGCSEEFALDCHDLSLENVFVDAEDNTKVTCIIDWESTTTRPLWACAHLPACLQSSPFTANLFRKAVGEIAAGKNIPATATRNARKGADIASLAKEWLYYESTGLRLRMCHRFVEWDGWEEGLIDTILGPEEHEEEWFKDLEVDQKIKINGDSCKTKGITEVYDSGIASPMPHDAEVEILRTGIKRKLSAKLPFDKEKEKENVLNTTGDICGGRGGELGRRLEAWLTINGHGPNSLTRGDDTLNHPEDNEVLVQ